MFGTYCHNLHYHCLSGGSVLRVTDAQLDQCQSTGFVVIDDFECSATQSAVIVATPSAYISDLWVGYYHAGLFIIGLGLIVIALTLGAQLGRSMFPKSL